MVDQIGDILRLAASAVNIFSRNQQSTQAGLVLKEYQGQNIVIQKLQLSLQEKQCKLASDLQELGRIQVLGQARKIELLKEQIEYQKTQIEAVKAQLSLQLIEIGISQESLGIQTQSLKTQDEILEVLSLQKFLLSIIALTALIWLGIQVFPIVFPWLKASVIFALKEIIILKNGLIGLLEVFLQSILKVASIAMKFVVEQMSSIRAWIEGVTPTLLEKISQLAHTIWHCLEDSCGSDWA